MLAETEVRVIRRERRVGGSALDSCPDSSWSELSTRRLAGARDAEELGNALIFIMDVGWVVNLCKHSMRGSPTRTKSTWMDESTVARLRLNGKTLEVGPAR